MCRVHGSRQYFDYVKWLFYFLWNGVYPTPSFFALSGVSVFGEQGWRSDESALFLPTCPTSEFDSRTRRHMWVEFVVGSLLCYSAFPLSSKTNISKFQFDPGMHRHFSTSSCHLLGAPWVNKLHIYNILFFFTFTFLHIRVTQMLPETILSLTRIQVEWL